MKSNKWKWLQLFADGAGDGAGDGGSGGNASATVVEGADDGHQRLLELGVPADKIRNRAYKTSKSAAKSVEAEQTEPAAKPSQQVAAAATNEPTEGKAKKPSWDEIKDDPDYKQEISKLIQARLKQNGKDGENHAAMAEANKALALYYGLDAENIDYAALAQKITSDDTLVEARAARNGVDTDIQRKLDAYESMRQQHTAFSQEQAKKQMLSNHYNGLKNQEPAVKALFPDFDLDKELASNPEFARLTGPGVNVPVEKAYKLCHQDEIMTAAAAAAQQQAATKIANSIRSGSRRPVENGSASQAPSVTTFDYKNASREQREAFKKEIYASGARGEYIRPGRR